jgi:hypothetical protein
VVRRSPQEKKRLSYLKDGRNNYGENDKSSRRSIRTRKRSVNSANRRREHLVLAEYRGSSVPSEADQVEQALHRRRLKSWRKFPDAPLGAVVIGSLKQRVKAGSDDAARAGERIGKVRRRIDGLAGSEPRLPLPVDDPGGVAARRRLGL